MNHSSTPLSAGDGESLAPKLLASDGKQGGMHNTDPLRCTPLQRKREAGCLNSSRGNGVLVSTLMRMGVEGTSCQAELNLALLSFLIAAIRSGIVYTYNWSIARPRAKLSRSL